MQGLSRRRQSETSWPLVRICEPEVAAATSDGKLGVVERAMKSWKGSFAACEDSKNTAEFWDSKTLNKMSKLWTLVKGVNQTISSGGACMCCKARQPRDLAPLVGL